MTMYHRERAKPILLVAILTNVIGFAMFLYAVGTGEGPILLAVLFWWIIVGGLLLGQAQYERKAIFEADDTRLVFHGYLRSKTADLHGFCLDGLEIEIPSIRRITFSDVPGWIAGTTKTIVMFALQDGRSFETDFAPFGAKTQTNIHQRLHTDQVRLTDGHTARETKYERNPSDE
jgi:hypothetical protein